MARAGRKRKEGKRDAKGKLRPINMPDGGNDKAKAKKKLFGTDGWDAVGRAYRTGLLGDDGQALMDAARRIKVAHQRTGLIVGNYQCPLNQARGGGMNVDLDPESARRRQQRVFDSLWASGPRNTMASSAFYGLVITEHPDSGPGWLDRLILGGATDEDREQLDAAVSTLKKLAA